MNFVYAWNCYRNLIYGLSLFTSFCLLATTLGPSLLFFCIFNSARSLTRGLHTSSQSPVSQLSFQLFVEAGLSKLQARNSWPSS